MQSITVRNVNHALPVALALLRDTGKAVAPRGQMTREIEGPFSTTYTNPTEMVCFDPQRDANPVFHFMEALWILAGRDDVQFLAYFLPRMADFSDDGKTFHAPYGYRLRSAYGFDQIEFCIKKLQADPDTRQAVASIWHPQLDWQISRDLPCNDMLLFKIREGKLRLTVCNRSNDAVLGAYGANVVQFSTLQRYMAGVIGVDVGTYTQVSDSFHVYESNPFWQSWLAGHASGVPSVDDPYENNTDEVYAHQFMFTSEVGSGEFDDDLKTFFKYWDEVCGPSSSLLNERNYATNSFVYTVLPMLQTLLNWRAGKRAEALEVSRQIMAGDWQVAVRQWMQRRIDKATV